MRNNETQFTQSFQKGISGFIDPEDLPMFILQNTCYPLGKPMWVLINILFLRDRRTTENTYTLSHQFGINTSPQAIYI